MSMSQQHITDRRCENLAAHAATPAICDPLESRRLMSSMSGTVYNDLNANGIQDKGEPGLEGWVIVLRDANGSTVSQRTSDKYGHYQISTPFYFMRPNPYTAPYAVVELVQPGWQLTQPGTGRYSLPGTIYGTYTGNFGNYYVGSSTVSASAPAASVNSFSTITITDSAGDSSTLTDLKTSNGKGSNGYPHGKFGFW